MLLIAQASFFNAQLLSLCELLSLRPPTHNGIAGANSLGLQHFGDAHVAEAQGERPSCLSS